MLYSTKFRNHKVEFQPYTSRQEKDILLACSTGAEDEIDQALVICGITGKIIKFLTNDEKIVLLYKLREVSVGDEMPAKFVCPHCHQPVETYIKIGGVFLEPKKKSPWVQDPGIADAAPEACFKEGYGLSLIHI